MKIPKKDEYIKFKTFGRKMKSLFLVHANFESILPSENKGKQNPNDSYTKKYQKHVASSYGYKLVLVDDQVINSVSLLNHS